MPKEQKYMFMAVGAAMLLLFLSWEIAFFANGLYGYKFPIDSAWQGFMTLSGAGMLNLGRYFVDSWKNSEQGKMPIEEVNRNEDSDKRGPLSRS